jgi:hypothetical protein
MRDEQDRAITFGVAVVGLTHPSKAATKAMNAATGSQGFIAAARAGWMFMRETDDEGGETERTLMLPTKNNLSPLRNNGLAYRIAGCDLGIERHEFGPAERAAEAEQKQRTVPEPLQLSGRRGLCHVAGDFCHRGRLPIRSRPDCRPTLPRSLRGWHRWTARGIRRRSAPRHRPGWKRR